MPPAQVFYETVTQCSCFPYVGVQLVTVRTGNGGVL